MKQAAPQPASITGPATRAARRVLAAMLLGPVILGAGCAVRSVELQNLEPARELARAAQPPGSVATGWRVYQQRCADCHGPAAGGGDGAPDLTERLRDIGPHRFVDLVLRRYDWGLPPGSAGAPRETLVDEIVARRLGEMRMPAWQGEPVVSAHVMDLYAYLSARAQGALGPGRPPR
jgi:hypothetical protein